MHIYVELFKAKESWLALTGNERARYFERAGSSIGRLLQEPGVELVGVGRASDRTSNHAGYDFFAVWKLPDAERVRLLEQGIADDGWYEYFDQVNASGELEELGTTLSRVLAA